MTTQVCESATKYPLKEGQSPEYRGYGPTPDLEDAVRVPSGREGAAVPVPLPSGDPICGLNFSQGIANTVVILRHGRDYLYKNPNADGGEFPSIYIPGYRGTPVPVVDCEHGELVAILTACVSFDPNAPSPTASILPNDAVVGIKSCDPNYNIVLGGFMILNTGFNYCDPEILIYDRDREDYNGKAKLTIVDGRIVDSKSSIQVTGSCVYHASTSWTQANPVARRVDSVQRYSPS